jgi:hypothetical protein
MFPEFIDPCTDKGFKRLMHNDEFVIYILNSILPARFGISLCSIQDKKEVNQRAPSSPLTTVKQRTRTYSTPDPIASVDYQPTQEDGLGDNDRSIIFDVLAVTDRGEIVNIEMQMANHPNLTDRLVYYTSRLVARQGWSGKDHEVSIFSNCISSNIRV